ncbi:MAG TPA: acyl-CoA dehydrogenase [Polyangia bacterium]|nr:acyl-CoA dehydrogenase [Polyangia bacterium]
MGALLLDVLELLVVVAAVIPPLRRAIFTRAIMRLVSRTLPRMGDTERIALEAGTVWWDGDLFSGNPDWTKLLRFKPVGLTAKEQAFIDGPVAELCAMLDEWQIENDKDLPPEAWRFIKSKGFFGMIIPEAYGGLGFSAAAHSAVVVKLSSRSLTAAVTVMVPNSLGPAELLLHYGTDAQKSHYLPRLAAAEEIPCFALTGPEAGSDAAATASEGVVSRGTWQGREVLGIRLNWRKRYITLAPIATLVGLAFRLRDPDGLLDRGPDAPARAPDGDLGITCALVPANLPGITIGQRHDPLGIPFQNGPTEGHGVFVPVDAIIGGAAYAGHGWRMLMESLAAGRSVSLPGLSVAGAEFSARATSAYALVRKQFDLPIGRFEGIEEPLARIGGMAYLMNAARVLTCGAVDAGERPAVVSAIVKAYLTEGMRGSLVDAMDVRAGAGICRGPRNMLARGYISAPIAITVEGANILTRSLIIYGQGAIRCHPYVLKEMRAAAAKDVAAFDSAFFGHIGFIFANVARLAIPGLAGGKTGDKTAGRLSPVVRRGLRRLGRASAAFALASDVAMATLGGQLKRREKLSGRLADALAWMYLGSAAAKRFVDEGQRSQDLPFLRWSLDHALWRIDEALAGLLANLPNRPAAWVLRVLIFPFGGRRRPPSDRIGAAVARTMLEDPAARDRLTGDIYLPGAADPGMGRLEAAFAACQAALPVEAKVRDAVRARRLPRDPEGDLLDRAVTAGVISPEERRLLAEADRLREDAIQVDAFDDLRRPEAARGAPSGAAGEARPKLSA